MTLALDIPAPRAHALGPGMIAALAVLTAAVLSVLLSPAFPALAVWPESWTLPVNDWITWSVGGFLDWAKPFGRFLTTVMSGPMDLTNWALTETPWPAVCGVTLGLCWWIGGWRLLALGVAALSFVLASGYWIESMNTMALVAVSVPLALALGLAAGVLSHEWRRARHALETILDVMQTVPTFAYLTPLLVFFGFGPVVGLIASAIYAAPPMARNVLLGLERVDPEIREAGVMSGATRVQQLWSVKLPAAASQILVGLNQCVMAAFSMVIIAAVIGGFEDIGWEVVDAVRKAAVGPGLLAGLVIVAFAILIDRMSAGLADTGHRGDWRIAAGIAAAGMIIAVSGLLPAASGLGVLDPAAGWVDQAVGTFTREHGAALDAVKNGAMFYGLLPLRIGLDDAVLPFTWGFPWTGTMSVAFLGTAAAIAALLVWRGRIGLASAVLFGAFTIHTGISNLPWPVVIVGATALGWRAGGWGLAAFAGLSLAAILSAGLWDRAMQSVYLSGAAVIACAIVGGGLGLLAAVSPMAWRVLRPVCDTLQTIPLFVFMIPILMFFQIGEFSAFLAICAYAIVPMIRYTRHGLTTTPHDLLEAAIANGATPWQIMRDVRFPWAAPTILLGLNQTILYAFSMLVIAALIGTTDLGQAIYLALGQYDVGLGIAAGGAMALLALIADRLLQAFAAERRKVLGL